ncbi:MAG: cytochrome c-type biogenesis protein CcmH [Holosporales bacterium]
MPLVVRLVGAFLLCGPVMADEEVVRRLFEEVRCLECGGQSILDANTASAHELKQYIRAEIASGRSADEVRAQLRESYGEEILSRPVWDWHTVFLWLAPFIGLLAAALMMVRRLLFHRIRHH